jgi:hypothetical protein
MLIHIHVIRYSLFFCLLHLKSNIDLEISTEHVFLQSIPKKMYAHYYTEY